MGPTHPWSIGAITQTNEKDLAERSGSQHTCLLGNRIQAPMAEQGGSDHLGAHQALQEVVQDDEQAPGASQESGMNMVG